MAEWVTIDDLKSVEDSQEHDMPGSKWGGAATDRQTLQAALAEENSRLNEQVALQEMSSSSSTDSDDGLTRAMIEETQVLEKQIQELQASLGQGLDISNNDTESEVEKEAARNTEKLKSLHSQLASVTKGLDLCFLVDCTGSMGWCIEQVKSKVQEIVNAILDAHSGAGIRLAFVGYRDYGTVGYPNGKHEVQDFVGSGDLATFEHFVRGVQSINNCDNYEDVAGGLQNALGLSWQSSTRLIIHFCDWPCHGKKYHDSTCHDYHPTGDPKGLVLEELMQRLCDRRVDYYFAAITEHTTKMMQVMQKCYMHSHNAEFKVMEWKDAATSFVPLVLASVSSSMQRSAHFNELMASADSKLDGFNEASRTLFHSTVG